MHVLCGLRRDQTVQRLPELRRRLRPAPDPARTRMAAGRMRGKQPAVGQARASEIQRRGCRGACGTDTGDTPGAAVAPSLRAKRSNPESLRGDSLDCFVASLLAMTNFTVPPESLRRQNCSLDLAEADAIAVALAPAAHDEGIAVFQERALDAARQVDRLGAVPADLQQTAALVLLGTGNGAGP